MKKFCIGQKVICIDGVDYSDTTPDAVVVSGQIYTVKGYSYNEVKLAELPDKVGSWKENRFAPIDTATSSNKPVDDYTCKVCHNTKCSSTEKSCWKCGELIKP